MHLPHILTPPRPAVGTHEGLLRIEQNALLHRAHACPRGDTICAPGGATNSFTSATTIGIAARVKAAHIEFTSSTRRAAAESAAQSEKSSPTACRLQREITDVCRCGGNLEQPLKRFVPQQARLVRRLHARYQHTINQSNKKRGPHQLRAHKLQRMRAYRKMVGCAIVRGSRQSDRGIPCCRPRNRPVHVRKRTHTFVRAVNVGSAHARSIRDGSV